MPDSVIGNPHKAAAVLIREASSHLHTLRRPGPKQDRDVESVIDALEDIAKDLEVKARGG